MRILISAFGTRGDVQPMIALARVLQHRGHAIDLFVPPNFAAWARDLGLDPKPLGMDFERFIADHGENVWGSVETVKREIALRAEAMAPVAECADVYLSSAVCVASAIFSARFRKPGRYVAFSPSLFRSADYPSPLTPWQHLPRALNRASWQAEAWLWNHFFLKTFNELRSRFGLGPVGDLWEEILGQGAIIASEKNLAAPGADATGPFVQTGAWFFDDPEEVPAEVEAFLRTGPPPVFIGFGSMTDSHAGRTMDQLLEAIRLAGTRAIIARGWAGLDALKPPEQVLIVGATPHAKIFPRCSAVVHHGGAGTLHQALRAGVPQIVAPHLVDQFFWAERLARCGLTPGNVSRARLQPRRLARLLRSCAGDSALRGRCREFAARVSRRGLEETVLLIEGIGRAMP